MIEIKEESNYHTHTHLLAFLAKLYNIERQPVVSSEAGLYARLCLIEMLTQEEQLKQTTVHNFNSFALINVIQNKPQMVIGCQRFYYNHQPIH